ncbi:phenylacetate--CoA ligase family protein [Cupriavidus necator]|uniref:phenylacetate--CoA ligase family protein n=1 Tax=Cupriavidus necator TaxID=106590 RepID=UPI001E47F1B5|nr:phenylacetate--CoA ligase family protein [Cupriavidus necator]
MNTQEISRIFVSPGPIFEPLLHDDHSGNGLTKVLKQAGIGAGDRVLNTWAYHLVPAGLLLDDALRAVGATVIPGGTGNAELQAQIVMELGVTCICASTAFFITLCQTLEAQGHRLPQDWCVRNALLGGEMGDWMGKRCRLEMRYGIRTFAAYATGDLGLIGYECDGVPGYRIDDGRIVQVCDPASGVPLPLGEPGEIVVSTLNPAWPLIRFGTGDVTYATALHPDGSVQRTGMLQGRVGQAVKVREIFVYPRQIEDLVLGVPGLTQAQAVVRRPAHRDELTLRVVLVSGADLLAIDAEIRTRFQSLTRLRLDQIEPMGTATAGEMPLLLDARAG